jgi:DNA-dependent protein kinase catalytic subunit
MENVSQEIGLEATQANYIEYFLFWNCIFQEFDGSTDEKFTSILVNGAMSAILSLPNNLNLALKSSDPDETDKSIIHLASDITSLVAVVGKDFNIFIDYVAFCERFLLKIPKRDFCRWVYLLCECYIESSTKNPLVSGFYRLLATVVGLAEKYGIFRNLQLDDIGNVSRMADIVDSDSYETSAKESPESIEKCFAMLSQFLKEVLFRQRQYKDELLASCLKFVLVVPLRLLTVQDLVLPMKEALRLGLSYTPIASVALNALEKWSATMPPDDLQPLFEHVLPGLSDYLLGDSDISVDDASVSRAQAGQKKLYVRKKYYLSGQVCVFILSTNWLELTETQDESMVGLKELKIRVLKFLGSIGHLNKYLLSESFEESELLAWDRNKNVKFRLPFKEVILEIYLG